MKKQKDLIQLIEQLLAVLCKLKQQRVSEIYTNIEQFDERCREILKATHPFYIATEKQWFGAVKRVEQRLNVTLTDFAVYLQKFREQFPSEEIHLPSPGQIFSEFRQIEDEFGQFNCDLEEGTLSVITDPIVLEGIALGAFEIRLTIERLLNLCKDSPYEIIALEPNPAGSDERVTHPHVSENRLCEGDGHIPIRRALAEGRICDFFTIIVQILQTYNPNSPYVSLSEWDGYSCYDCGYTVSSDDRYYCENCNNDFCDQCSSYCKICDTTLCRGCLSECPDCLEPVCTDCASACKECERIVCNDCLNEDEICFVCIDRKEAENEEAKQSETHVTMPSTSVQPDSLGQTRIPA